MIYLILWLICAIITALIASSKNRSPIAWALLAIPLGLIATIIVACSTKLPSKEEVAGARAPADSKACPRCAETVKAAAQICRFCGHTFDTAAIAAMQKELPWTLVEDWGSGYGMYEYKGENLTYRQGAVHWRTSQFNSPEIALKSIDSYLA